MTSSCRHLFRFFLFCSLFTTAAFAQLPTSSLNGFVRDPQGAVVTGAKVTLTNQQTGAVREVTTGNEGNYLFTNLQPGLYRLRVEASGFGAQEFQDVRLEVGRASTQDVSVSLERVGEVVTVTGGGAAVELTQSQVASHITAQTLENIPLNGRNFLELAYLLPGNRPAANFDPTKTNTLEVSSAGAFGRGGNITVDGGDNNDEVVGGTLMNFPQDGVQEFQIATNRFSAEVGRSGSSIINIVTKSGTNQLHGSAFFFFRHRELQGLPATFARVRNGQRVPAPSFDREQYGGSIGGPIKQDRAFWFVAVENRNQDAVVEVGERDFANRQVVASSASAPLDDFLLNARTDFRISDDDNLFVRYAFNRSEEVANGSLRQSLGAAANRQSSLNRFSSVLADWTRTLSPTQVNNLSLHVNFFQNSIPAFTPNDPITDPTGLAAGNEIRFGGILQDGGNFRIPQGVKMNRYQVRDTFSWARGKHSLRLGGEWQNIGNDAIFDLFGSGTIITTEAFATVDRNGPANTGVPDGLLNDLDIPVAAGILSGAPLPLPFVPFYRTTYLGFFVQDDWKAASNLTLNLGLRWDWDSNVFAQGDEFSPCPEPLTTPAASDSCVWLRNIFGPKKNPNKNFGPRFGFSWDPWGHGTTAVRGGYGVYYDRVITEVNLLELLLDGRDLPLALTAGSTIGAGGNFVADPSTGQIVSLANPFGGATQAFGVGINLIDAEAKHPLVQQWTLGVQHQMGQNWSVSADAVHNFGNRLLIGRTMRGATSRGVTHPQLTCPGNGVQPCTVIDPLNPALGGQPIILIESSAKAWYSGLLASLRKRQRGEGWLRWGFQANYTLSKSLDFANDDQIPFNTDNPVEVTQGVVDIGLEKGYGLTDERHRFTLHGVFEFPWQIRVSPILTISSDVPMDSLVPRLNNRLPIIRRNALGRDIRTIGELNDAIAQWNALPTCNIPTVVFPCNTDLVGGRITLDQITLRDASTTFGDSFSSLDLRLSKTFNFAERHNLDLIGEVFNVFNVTNIRGFNNNNYAGFGRDITAVVDPNDPTKPGDFNRELRTAGGFFGAGGPRAFQFAVRYRF